MNTATSLEDASTSLRHLELHDVRLFVEAQLDVATDGSTVLVGPNGSGKTTLLEAVSYLGSQRSFRTTARDAMVRNGEDRAIVRATLERESRPLVVESEIRASGGTRTLVNHRLVHGRAELADAVPVTVFSPDDLGVVQGPPARRREVVDAALRLVDHMAGANLDAMERVLRQRAALLRQAQGRLGPEVASTLDVWDERLVAFGMVVSDARRALLEDAGPLVEEAYASLADSPPGSPVVTAMTYVPGWQGDLADALVASRRDDVRRAATTVGPHRDEVVLCIEGRDARVRASQGEQRSFALALRLALHRLVTGRRGGAPLLLLDDVFSELDPDRSRALVRHLPRGQALLTTATPLPEGIEVGAIVDVRKAGRRG
jgi:DNA replication and repair protein RecF